MTENLFNQTYLTKFFEKYYFDQEFSDPILTIFFVFLKTFFDQYFIYQNISMGFDTIEIYLLVDSFCWYIGNIILVW